MLIKILWCVIPAECHTKRKVKNNVGLDLTDNYIRHSGVTV